MDKELARSPLSLVYLSYPGTQKTTHACASFSSDPQGFSPNQGHCATQHGFTAFSSQPDLPSANGAGSYRKDSAVLTDIPAGAVERAALAKQLPCRLRRGSPMDEPRGHSSFWSIVTACRPSGPPLAKDLFALAKPKDRYE